MTGNFANLLQQRLTDKDQSQTMSSSVSGVIVLLRPFSVVCLLIFSLISIKTWWKWTIRYTFWHYFNTELYNISLCEFEAWCRIKIKIKIQSYSSKRPFYWYFSPQLTEPSQWVQSSGAASLLLQGQELSLALLDQKFWSLTPITSMNTGSHQYQLQCTIRFGETRRGLWIDLCVHG